MKSSDTGNAYDTITHLWERDEFNFKNGIQQHQRAIKFSTDKGKALDVGCGFTGRFIDLLISEGFTPDGVDVSAKMIELARNRHPELNFYHQDICEWQIPETYDFITAWDSIWHVPLSEQENVISKLVDALNPDGILIFSFGGVDEAGEHSNTAMGPEVYYSSLGTKHFLELVIRLSCTCKHLEFDQYPEAHAYLIVQKTA